MCCICSVDLGKKWKTNDSKLRFVLCELEAAVILECMLSSQLFLVAPHLVCPHVNSKHNLVKILYKSIRVSRSPLLVKIVIAKGKIGLHSIDMFASGDFLELTVYLKSVGTSNSLVFLHTQYLFELLPAPIGEVRGGKVTFVLQISKKK